MPATVLLCDNEEPLRALARAALDGSGYEIAEARDGDEAVERARALRPDVIVLDMMMPGRSGIEVLAELQADPATAGIPVLMLTARAQAADRQAAARAGAARFLAKPFSPRELAAVVGELVGEARA
jgi:CheY-like chemotaxis protein